MSVVAQGTSGSDDERRQSDDDRCLLDCLCKDEMKCCKSVPVISPLERDRETARGSATSPRAAVDAGRSLTSPDGLSAMDSAGDEVDAVAGLSAAINRTFCSLPNIVQNPAASNDNAAGPHQLVNRTRDTPPYKPSQVVRLLFFRIKNSSKRNQSFLHCRRFGLYERPSSQEAASSSDEGL